MTVNEIRKYTVLNTLAEPDGIVILGGSEDISIPLCELRQAFSIESRLYNRSVIDLSIKNAISVYDACVAPLNPETVLLHIGEADLMYFKQNSSDFDQKYRELILHIQQLNKKCRIAVISLKNYEKDDDITKLNTHLKFIAESERCEFGDIAEKHLWNPQCTRSVMNFIYDIGFVRPLKHNRPIYDLIRMLFCYESPCTDTFTA